MFVLMGIASHKKVHHNNSFTHIKYKCFQRLGNFQEGRHAHIDLYICKDIQDTESIMNQWRRYSWRLDIKQQPFQLQNQIKT